MTTLPPKGLRTSGEKTMGLTHEDADDLVKAFFRAHEQVDTPGEELPGLNAKGFGAAMLGEGEVFFEYHSDAKALECSALIYRFRSPPKPGIVEGFQVEAASGTDTGGGTVDFEKENNGLFLSKTFPQRVDYGSFVEAVDSLLAASIAWAKDVLPRVSQKVHGR